MKSSLTLADVDGFSDLSDNIPSSPGHQDCTAASARAQGFGFVEFSQAIHAKKPASAEATCVQKDI